MECVALAKYRDLQVPRYTSYPPATAFHAGIRPETYRAWLADVPQGAVGSLYLHVPFCRSMCWYCGCHTTITREDTRISAYVATLRREVGLVADALGRRRLDVAHVHFGGGTPSILQPAEFADLMALLRARFLVRPGAEVAIEIDPRRLTAEMAGALGKAGVNRVSLGVQTFDPAVQKAINRVQSFEQTAAAVSGLRRGGVAGINLDVIYGLPHQTVESCIETIDRCLTLLPDRFAVFGYAHVPGFKAHQKKIDAAELPGGRERHAQAEAIAAVLEQAGYVRIGLDHFARPEDSLASAHAEAGLRRNFQGYTTDAADVLLGFGASAIGRLPQGYVQNIVPVGDYSQAIAAGDLATGKGHHLTAGDRLRGEIIERLMCDFQVDLEEVCGRHQASVDDLLASAAGLTEMIADGLVELHGGFLSGAPANRLLVRAVAALFDAYRTSLPGRPGRQHAQAV